MVKIRCEPRGRQNQRCFRLVVADARKRRGGPIIEQIGVLWLATPTQQRRVELQLDRAEHWLNKGAQPNGTVARIIQAKGLDHPIIRKVVNDRPVRQLSGQQPARYQSLHYLKPQPVVIDPRQTTKCLPREGNADTVDPTQEERLMSAAEARKFWQSRAKIPPMRPLVKPPMARIEDHMLFLDAPLDDAQAQLLAKTQGLEQAYVDCIRLELDTAIATAQVIHRAFRLLGDSWGRVVVGPIADNDYTRIRAVHHANLRSTAEPFDEYKKAKNAFLSWSADARRGRPQQDHTPKP